MRLLPLALSLLAAVGCASSAVPRELPVQVTPRQGFLAGVPIDVVVADQRKDTTGAQLLAGALTQAVREAYPAAASVTAQPATQFYTDASPGRITLKVAVAGYGAGFGTAPRAGIGVVGGVPAVVVLPEGRWNGLTVMQVGLYDGRGGAPVKTIRDVSQVVSKPNTFGYRTAREALAESFEAAVRDMLLFVDGALQR